MGFTQTTDFLPLVLKGIVAQLQLLITIVLTLKLGRIGRIVAFALAILSLVNVSMGYFIIGIEEALTGVFVAGVSLFMLSLISYLFEEKNRQYKMIISQKERTEDLNQELKESEIKLQQLNEELQHINLELDSKRHVLQKLAYYDVLTGLPNRAMLIEHIGQQIEKVKSGILSGFSVLFLDLDNFKQINDTMGHFVGDEYLKVVATRLKKITRNCDFCGRLSGDEFCIVTLSSGDPQKLRDYCESIRMELIKEIVINGEELITGVSIGVSQYPQDGITVKELLTAADISMYRAKKSGKNEIDFSF